MNHLSGRSLVDASGRSVAANDVLNGKTVIAFYFSAHWCPPCRMFTPQLKAAFEEANRRSPGRKSTVVFVSSDRSASEQMSYMRESHGNWPAVSAGSDVAQRLSSAYGVRGIPALIVVNASDGSVITSDGRSDVSSSGAAAFDRWEALAAPSIDVGIVDLLHDNSAEAKREAAEILLKLVDNVIREPQNLKFRSVRLSNPKIESKLLTAAGAFEILFSMGFEEGDDSLILPLSVPISTLQAFKSAIEKVLRGAPASAIAASAATRPSTANEANRPNLNESSQMSNEHFQRMKRESEFYEKLEGERVHVLRYEDSAAQAKALEVIPKERLESQAKAKWEAIKAQDASTQESLLRDLLLLELLHWFKAEFFHWVDAPKCDTCGGDTTNTGMVVPTAQEQADGAGRVEGYSCKKCAAAVRFPRYHAKPAVLLETRRGRCGEWANCFALLCRTLGFDTRHVLDWTDHVWVEVYSEAEARWLHADPCEDVLDKPLVYEVGWGKKLTYVIAASKDEVQDVSWRYSVDHDAMKKRRSNVREAWLTSSLLRLTEECQKAYSEELKNRLTERRLVELVQLMSPKDQSKLNKEELLGRQSGSAAWRLARGEMGLGIETFCGNVWKLTEEEKASKVFHLEYDVVEDVYVRHSRGGERVVGWQNGLAECEDVIRKEEFDWGQTYLARREGSSKAAAKWQVDLSDSALAVKTVELFVSSSTFQSGKVVWQLCDGAVCLIPQSGSTLKSEGLSGAKKVSLTAMLSGGSGDLAWQHTQLFRTHKDAPGEEKVKFRLIIKMQDA